MPHTNFFKKNPGLYLFLPLLYMVWEDSVLTPSEIKSLNQVISGLTWLSDEEKKILLTQIDPSSPPFPDVFKSWLSEIRSVTDQSSNGKESLADLGLKLAAANGSKVKAEEVKPSLLQLEASLGMISRESAFYFSNERGTQTEKHSTQHSFKIDKLADILDGDQKDIIQKVKILLSDPEFNYLDSDNLNEYREKVLQWCKLLAKQGYGSMAYPKEYGGQADMAAYFAIMEALSYHDLSLVIKFGVQFGLWGMSVYFLGTEKHHKKYLKDIGTLDLPGCFAMTETGHGSNVRGIETMATYIHQNKTFVIHTPNEIAKKEYIGNAALHGQKATVFAKLIIDGQDYGVSAFVVSLRDKSGKTMPGVTIEDCGRKVGLNGVDNGKIHFNHVVIPMEDMLDRFASVTAEG
ncbi:MAG TPA: acyl-CoA dehydrogenase family protein, partial [Cyclobacteriaceae bacterium]